MASKRLHARHAWLPEGWRNNVTISVADGLVSAVSPDTPPTGDAERLASYSPASSISIRTLFSAAWRG